MSIEPFIIGFNHKSAPIDIRDALSIPAEKLDAALKACAVRSAAKELVILSTCNRIEFYSNQANRLDLYHYLSEYTGLTIPTLKGYAYEHTGDEAFAHMVKVAASLDSMVLGEPQIFKQMKLAYRAAEDAHTVHANFTALFRHVFEAAKAIRAKTTIGHCPFSIALTAVNCASDTLDTLATKKSVVIGAGQTGHLLIQHLRSLGQMDITLVNRNVDRAQQVASQYHIEAQPLTALPHLLARADLVISATASIHPVVTHDMFTEMRRTKPMLLIDIAAPRDIAAEVGDLPFATLYNMDHLQQHISQHVHTKSQASVSANSIIEEHLNNYTNAKRVRKHTKTIVSMRQRAERIRDRLLAQGLDQLARGVPAEEVLKIFANRLTNTWLHQPTTSIRQASVEENEAVIHAAQRLLISEQ